uniref:SLAIN motif-containing protein-like n=1 Tax=Monopterus albus TaxID=43700 RepID=UPI0009B48847|nr:SLAIN motif-containing protein-like [Monopterus albus]
MIHLKAGCNSALTCSGIDTVLYNFNCQKDLWENESEEEESALDLVELLDVEDDVQDEESWLYESPKKQVFVDNNKSTLKWCRHVLDSPTPEMEAACRALINRLGQRSSSHFYRHPAIFHHTDTVGSSMDKTSVKTMENSSDSLDNSEKRFSHDHITTSYRLQDITDVHIMAHTQEAIENTDDLTPGNKTEASSSCWWQLGLSSLISSPCPSPIPIPKQDCQSPKPARLHQQLTQFKLLKFAQNQGRTTSPLPTSLHSLQAVRNSQSLETNDRLPANQLLYPPSGASPTRMGSSCWSLSLSPATMNSGGSLHSVRDSTVRMAAMKRLQRCQSLSPCRIPHAAKGHLSVHGRVFASPERSATSAWARNAPIAQ